MKVLLAEEMGMCFGVRDALAILDDVEHPETVTIHGQLVHNEVVLHRLSSRGFSGTSEQERGTLPATPRVVITAHGVSDAERRRLEAAGKEIVDTTCPLVARAHRAAMQLANEDRFVIVLGKRGHVEVEGLIGDLPACTVVQNVEEVQAWSRRRLGMVCQTTTPDRLAAAVREEVRRKNPDADFRFIDTVCHPTRNRQRALELLMEQVDAMVVVGGRNSNNTGELASRCRERGLPAFQVAHASELRPEWFREFESVGLTAGTSTLQETIDEVREALEGIARAKEARAVAV